MVKRYRIGGKGRGGHHVTYVISVKKLDYCQGDIRGIGEWVPCYSTNAFGKERKTSSKFRQKSIYVSPGSLVAAVITFLHKVLVLYSPEAAAIIRSDGD
ncbi:hypothetical protein TNCV_327391 [Trichonephila clavipes]|nr:hypothetical protein TNCV_327391 [Trichonephila clavipes]